MHPAQLTCRIRRQSLQDPANHGSLHTRVSEDSRRTNLVSLWRWILTAARLPFMRGTGTPGPDHISTEHTYGNT